MRYIIQKHEVSYHDNMMDVLLAMEQTSIERLDMWEQELLHAGNSGKSEKFMESPTYGDGGMAAAVRIATARKETKQ